MSTRFSDTAAEAEAVLIDLLRQAPAWQKMQQVEAMNDLVRRLALSGLRQRHPTASEAALRRRLADLALGAELAETAYGPLSCAASVFSDISPIKAANIMNASAAQVTLQVCHTFEELGIPYVIGGSLAGAVHGHSRATYDGDIVADVQAAHVPLLLARFQDDFYISEDAIYEAIERRGSFNLIHLGGMFKVDVFVAQDRPFDRAELARGRPAVLAEGERGTANVAAAEDVILAKLEWYRLGGESSTRQWEDVLGVLRVQGERLNRDYLAQMSAELGVADLLQRAEAETP